MKRDKFAFIQKQRAVSHTEWSCGDFSTCMFSYAILRPRRQCGDKEESPVIIVVISLRFIS